MTKDQMRAHYAQSKSNMVRKVLYYGYQMGFDKPTTEAEQAMRATDINKARMNRWLHSEHSAVRKDMDAMTHKELVKVVTQLERVYRDYLKRI